MAHPSAFLHARLPILDGHGLQLLMSAAGNHIRQEKRKEIHEPFLESKSTGVEHLTSGQLTVYVWMKRDVGRFCPGKLVPVLKIEGKCSCLRAKPAHIPGHLPIPEQDLVPLLVKAIQEGTIQAKGVFAPLFQAFLDK
jgi:hypothetical protein